MSLGPHSSEGCEALRERLMCQAHNLDTRRSDNTPRPTPDYSRNLFRARGVGWSAFRCVRQVARLMCVRKVTRLMCQVHNLDTRDTRPHALASLFLSFSHTHFLLQCRVPPAHKRSFRTRRLRGSCARFITWTPDDRSAHKLTHGGDQLRHQLTPW